MMVVQLLGLPHVQISSLQIMPKRKNTQTVRHVQESETKRSKTSESTASKVTFLIVCTFCSILLLILFTCCNTFNTVYTFSDFQPVPLLSIHGLLNCTVISVEYLCAVIHVACYVGMIFKLMYRPYEICLKDGLFSLTLLSLTISFLIWILL